MINIQEDHRNVVDKYKGQSNEAIAIDMAERAFPLHIAIENPQHDYNIGTIVRNCNAFNVAGVHIVGKKHWNRRGAMCTDKYLQLFHHPDIADFADWARDNNQRIIGVDNVETSTKLQQTNLPKDAVYIFGQEGPGISDEMKGKCEYLIEIEQFGSTR
jgi:tRNA G18 (ribose-2'-O)-methylase SpoU